MQQAPQLSQADAKSALDDAIAAFQVEENKQKILKILADVAQLPPEQQVMARMMQVLPAVQEIQQNALEKYGFNFPGGAMQAMMQIQVASQSDPDMAAKVKQLMSIAQGNFDGVRASGHGATSTLWQPPRRRLRVSLATDAPRQRVTSRVAALR